MIIEEAAIEALIKIGHPASIDEIYKIIVGDGLYSFDTPTPEHVLRTTIRRSTKNVERIDSRATVHFIMTAPEIYGLLGDNESKLRQSIAPKRIHRAKDKQEIVELLTGDGLGVFKEIWRLQLFAAHVGLALGRRVPLNAVDTGKGIDQSTFGNCSAWPGVLYLIAVTEANSADPLSSTQAAEDYRANAFEEYANGGLEILKDFFQGRSTSLDTLIEFLDTKLAQKAPATSLDLGI